MLVRLPYLPSRYPLVEILSGGERERQVADGVYEVTHHNFNYVLEANNRLVSDTPYEPFWSCEPPYDDVEVRLKALREHAEKDLPESYGVCDHWRQIIKRWPVIVTDDKPLVIAVTPIEKAAQPSSGGWRWHKWGEYIGEHEPQYEYLHDEPDIDQVYTWHLYEVRP